MLYRMGMCNSVRSLLFRPGRLARRTADGECRAAFSGSQYATVGMAWHHYLLECALMYGPGERPSASTPAARARARASGMIAAMRAVHCGAWPRACCKAVLVSAPCMHICCWRTAVSRPMQRQPPSRPRAWRMSRLSRHRAALKQLAQQDVVLRQLGAAAAAAKAAAAAEGRPLTQKQFLELSETVMKVRCSSV